MSLVNVTSQGDPLTNNNFLAVGQFWRKTRGVGKLTLLCEENKLPKILNTKSYWMGNMTAEKEQDLTVIWPFCTKHLTSRHWNGFFRFHMSCGTQGWAFTLSCWPGLVLRFSWTTTCFEFLLNVLAEKRWRLCCFWLIFPTNAADLICPWSKPNRPLVDLTHEKHLIPEETISIGFLLRVSCPWLIFLTNAAELVWPRLGLPGYPQPPLSLLVLAVSFAIRVTSLSTWAWVTTSCLLLLPHCA